VAELRCGLHVQERGVEAGQLLHGPLPPRRSATPALCHCVGGTAQGGARGGTVGWSDRVDGGAAR
jgi:hypothetical protein